MSTLKTPTGTTLTSPWWIAAGSCIALIVVNGSICVFPLAYSSNRLKLNLVGIVVQSHLV